MRIARGRHTGYVDLFALRILLCSYHTVTIDYKIITSVGPTIARSLAIARALPRCACAGTTKTKSLAIAPSASCKPTLLNNNNTQFNDEYNVTCRDQLWQCHCDAGAVATASGNQNKPFRRACRCTRRVGKHGEVDCTRIPRLEGNAARERLA